LTLPIAEVRCWSLVGSLYYLYLTCKLLGLEISLVVRAFRPEFAAGDHCCGAGAEVSRSGESRLVRLQVVQVLRWIS